MPRSKGTNPIVPAQIGSIRKHHEDSKGAFALFEADVFTRLT